MELIRVRPEADSWLSRAWGMVRSSWSGPLTSRSPELASWFTDGAPAASGVNVTEASALNYSAVWSAVSLISSTIASLPLIVYKRDGGGKSRFVEHPLYELLHDAPNPEMSALLFRETVQAHVLTWGNGYAEIQRNGAGAAVALWPITPDRVSPERDASLSRLRYRVRNPGGADSYIPADNMLHIPGLGWDGLLGYSVIAKARESIGLGMATERFGASFFGNGSTFGGVLSSPMKVDSEQADQIRNRIEAKHKGLDRSHRFLILGGDMKYTQLGIPQKDSQFLETRTFQLQDVARWFHVPPHMLAEMQNATFSNIEHQQQEFYTLCLRQWLVRWEQEIQRKLIPRLERKRMFAEHLVDGVLRADIKSRYDAYAVGRQWGWLSADDVRGFENMNPIGAGGDTYLVPMNMVPADKLDEMVDANIKKAETPPPAPVAPKAEGEVDEGAEDSEREWLRGLVESMRMEQGLTVEGMHLLALEHEQLKRDAVIAVESKIAADKALEQAQAEASMAAAELEEARAELATQMEYSTQVDEQRDALGDQVKELYTRVEAAEKAVVEKVHTAQELMLRESAAVSALGEARAKLATLYTSVSIEQSKRDARIVAHGRLYATAMRRLLRREIEQAKRYSATPAKLRTWIKNRYADANEIAIYRENLLPVLMVHAAEMGEGDPAALTDVAVEQHILRSVTMLMDAADSDPSQFADTIERVLQQWDDTRSERFAAELMQKEMGDVRDR